MCNLKCCKVLLIVLRSTVTNCIDTIYKRYLLHAKFVRFQKIYNYKIVVKGNILVCFVKKRNVTTAHSNFVVLFTHHERFDEIINFF